MILYDDTRMRMTCSALHKRNRRNGLCNAVRSAPPTLVLLHGVPSSKSRCAGFLGGTSFEARLDMYPSLFDVFMVPLGPRNETVGAQIAERSSVAEAAVIPSFWQEREAAGAEGTGTRCARMLASIDGCCTWFNAILLWTRIIGCMTPQHAFGNVIARHHRHHDRTT